MLFGKFTIVARNLRGGGMAIFFVQKNDGQRKLGSNTSVLRTSRIVRLDIDEGWCATET